MGLFSKRTTCTVCNCNESKKSLADGYICKDCISKCYPYIITMSWKNYKTDEIRMAISKSEKNKELLEIFTPTKTFKKMLSVDANHKLWMYGTSNIVFNFNDVVSYELIQDGESITKGGVGRAVAGGILFGGVGADSRRPDLYISIHLMLLFNAIDAVEIIYYTRQPGNR